MNCPFSRSILPLVCFLLIHLASSSQTPIELDSIEGISSVEFYGYPTPEITSIRLFFVQRNISKNVVVYDANRDESGTIDTREPALIYWKRYNDGLGGKEFELRWFERRLGYRLKIFETTNHSALVSIASYKKKKFRIVQSPDGSIKAKIEIKGRMSAMTYIFMHMAKDTFFPEINYIEIGGHDLNTGEFIFERFLP